MDAIPIIRIELENLREQVTHAMMCHNDELNGMIAETLSKTLT